MLFKRRIPLGKENNPILKQQEILKPSVSNVSKSANSSIRRIHVRPPVIKPVPVLIPLTGPNDIKVPKNLFYSKIEKINQKFNAFLVYRSKIKVNDDFKIINI